MRTLPAMSADGSRRAILAAFLANLGIAVAKLVGFFLTGAASMLAEAVHSLADSGNQGLLFLGGARAKRSPTDEHQFGYGRERYFWAFVVALVLFSMGGLFAIYEAIGKLRKPHEIESPEIAIGILLFAIALETWSFRTAVTEANHVRGNLGWWAFIRRSKGPELPVVLLEDLGALCGLVLALAGIVVAEITGNARFDATGSLAIGILLVVIAMILAVEMKGLLIGESAAGKDESAIRGAFESSPNVRRIIHLRTQHMGPDELLVAAKIEFDESLTFRQVAEAIDNAESRVRSAVPACRLIYVEPDCYRAQ